MVICTDKNQYGSEIKLFDAFCRTITFTTLLLNKGQVRPNQ